MQKTKFLIIGSNSFIGKHFIEFLKGEQIPFTGVSRGQFNLSAPNISSLHLDEQGYTHALIFAACAAISFCEKTPKESHQINVEGPLYLANELLNFDIQPIFFSSDYVFDGKLGNYNETSPLSPINEYGKQKSELEERLPGLTGGNHLLLRLSKIFSHNHDGSFLDGMITTLLNNQPLRVAYDQIFCPLSTDDLIPMILKLLKENKCGLYNLAGREAMSRLLIAQKLAQELGAPEELIQEISICDLEQNVLRPKNTSLNTDKIQNELEHQIIPLETSIQRCSLARKKRDFDSAALGK